MSGEDWIELLNLIPAEKHSQLNIISRTGVELSIDVIIRMERTYLVYRGRMVGNTDDGRVFFTPYNEIALIYINRFVREDEVTNIFDSIVPMPDASQPQEDPESVLSAGIPSPGVDPLALLMAAAPGKGSGLVPRILTTPNGFTSAKAPPFTGSGGIPSLMGSGLVPNIANMTLPPTPAKPAPLIPPTPVLTQNSSDTPQPKGSILDRLRAQRNAKK